MNPTPAPRSRSLLPLTEVVLVTVSLVTAATFWRVFSDGSFLPRLALFALSSHAVAIVARRRAWSLARAGAASLAALVVVVTVALYWHTTKLGLPTGATARSLRTDLGQMWAQFQQVEAPTPVTAPFLLVAGLALWWSAFVADWAAFRLWVPIEAVVPTGTVFVFASLFAAPRARVAAAALYVAAVLAFVLLHRVTRQQASGAWVTDDTRRGTRSLLRIGAVLVGATIVAGVLVGPNLPQATAKALVGWRDADGEDGSRTTVSPLVEIKGRLVDQTNQELFTVVSNERAYWRLTALDVFDGDIWSSNGEYEKAKDSLPHQGLPAGTPSAGATQAFDIRGLDTLWAPAAFQPTALDSQGADIRFEPDSSTLIVGTSLSTSDGLRYSVTSELARFDQAALRSATGTVPDEIRQRDTALPAGFSSAVGDLARTVTASSDGALDKALALQAYFRDNFVYSLQVPSGHSGPAIEAFLFETRAGYCEQFAGTFAAMARTLGLPARVAVGFTPGESSAQQPGLFRVRGEHAHAWPEVYLAGAGWVAFEPTPGRGIPNAEQYTGVPEQQSTGGGAGATTSTPATTPSSVVGGGDAAPRPTATPAIDRAGAGAATADDGGGVLSGAAVGLGAVLALVAVYVGSVLLARRRRRSRRRAQAETPEDQVLAAWAESVDDVGVLGLRPRPAETAAEFSGRSVTYLGEALLDDLVPAVDAADYSGGGLSPDDADAAWAVHSSVAAAVSRLASSRQKLAAALDPRRPERRWPLRLGRGARSRSAEPIEVVELP